MSSKPPPLFPTACGYCRNLGLICDNHTTANCPVKSSLPPCPICGISGAFNHTASQSLSKQTSCKITIQKILR
uniref:Nanos-type domain-containing protein n=1 Tax=Meloidogyne hapla TaxID=6305 RepID=A0A1I8BWA3_MELHA